MKTLQRMLPIFLLILPFLLLCGCENYHDSPEVNSLIAPNDPSIAMKLEDNKGFTLEKVEDGEGGYYLKIDVTDEFSLRGQAPVTPGESYRLSVTMKNDGAGPVIGYSFWKQPKTSLRHYTLRGENGSPPTSETQENYDEWRTFEETFVVQEGEDSFMLTLHAGEGTFYIRDIAIDRILP